MRDLIVAPDASPFRSMTLEKFQALAQANNVPTEWLYTDAEREATRKREMAGYEDGDLWVFAYGSLMWDPAFRFTDIRRAFLPGYARKFILKDIYGGRGTAEAPGVMAALDNGAGCAGIAYCIAEAAIEVETEVLWRRERIGPAYRAGFVPAELDGLPQRVLAFIADHDATLIEPDLPRADQVRYLATGAGLFGTSLDYIRQIEARFALLGIEDPDLSALHRDAEAYAAQIAGAKPA
ncbi:MAG: gamma-glutamylcyclotransferase [Pseudomonadota bacterium]